jgi:hypothetical protein
MAGRMETRWVRDQRGDDDGGLEKVGFVKEGARAAWEKRLG